MGTEDAYSQHDQRQERQMKTVGQFPAAKWLGMVALLLGLGSGCFGRSTPSPGAVTESGVPASVRAHARLAVVYFQAELWCTLTGEYPRELGDLVTSSPGVPLKPLGVKEIIDPFSAFGLPLRYRLTPDGPEVASVGPDRRWGGWPGQNSALLVGEDDIVYSPRNALYLGTRFMYAAYSEAIAKGTVQPPSVHVQVDSERRESLEKAVRDWRPGKALHPTSVPDLIDQLQSEWGISAAFERKCFESPTTGLGNLTVLGRELDITTLQMALSLLHEATPRVIDVLAWEPPSVTVLCLDSWHRAEATFWQLMRQKEYADLHRIVERLGGYPGDFLVILPGDWFDDAAIERLSRLCERLFGQGRFGLYRTSRGVVITELRPWGDVYLLLNRFAEFVPDLPTAVKAMEEIKGPSDAE